MEYCELGSLENARLSPVYTDQEKTINHYFAQLIKGVKKLHNIKLMHRDLKPANILVTKINDKTRLKIADFGLARDAPDSIANLTFCGTPYYMAP
uniref:Protein kinase domain-containing protein n=2 Tax=Meloidogyne TaxID=189290 RepID=A0A6V7WMX9_MELEN|nr:unnamed protein product [Meloidogyne enterolobii]